MRNEITKKPVDNKELIWVVAQAMYGNRTGMQLRKDDIDRIVLGWLDAEMFKTSVTKDEIDRSIVRIPGAEHLALVYNKNQEMECLARKEELLRENGYVLKPLAVIPELGLELYSRCIVCRMDADGEPASLEAGDSEMFMKYLAE